MRPSAPGPATWSRRLALLAAAVAALGILGFYAGRLTMPLPIFASDEAAYLIRALFADGVTLKDPLVPALNNGAAVSAIRLVHVMGGDIVVWDRLANAVAYLAGLAGLHRMAARGRPADEQLVLLLIAVGFPYYRFAFSNLPEGLFVGVLALVCAATAGLYRRRPAAHALAAGGLCAVLVLVKPNGMATVAALLAVMVLEAAASRQGRLLALRVGLFAIAFFAIGNLIQAAAQEAVASPASFFVGDFYGSRLGATIGAAGWAAAPLILVSMIAGAAILAGPAIVVGLSDLARRRRAAGGAFEMTSTDLVFLLLTLSLAATLPMVTLFVMKIAADPNESYRLWGRYFEFFAPMIWLAAGPALGRIEDRRRTGLVAAGVLLAGLAGLLACLHAGIVLFPWDSSILTAFFQPDPQRANLPVATPYRALAAGAVVIAAGAAALGARPAWMGLGLTLALGGLSTQLDHIWLGPLVLQRTAFERDVRAIAARLPSTTESVLLAPDANDGALGFLRLEGRPRVIVGPPGEVAASELSAAQSVVVSGPDLPTGGQWVRRYQGTQLSLFQRAP